MWTRRLDDPRDALGHLGGRLRAGVDAGLHEVLDPRADEAGLGARIAADAAQVALDPGAGGLAAALEAAQVPLDAAPELPLDLVARGVAGEPPDRGDDRVARRQGGADLDRDDATGVVDVALDRRPLDVAARG